jgi:hypothetical protein
MIGTMKHPPKVHAVIEVSGRTDDMTGYEVKPIGLGAVAGLLKMPVADFDCVRVASAKADIRCCPVCRAAGVIHQG